MPRRVLVAMVLSNLEHKSRSLGGVDSVCQMHLDALLNDTSGNDYLIVSFNPANDTSDNGKENRLAPHVRVISYNVKNRNSFAKFIPNVVWQNLQIEMHARKFRPHVVHTHIPSWKIFPSCSSKKITTLHSEAWQSRSSSGFLNSLIFETLLPELGLITSAVVTTVSLDVHKKLSKRPYCRVEFVPNNVNNIYFGVERPQQVRPDVFRFVMTGSLIPRKRVSTAVDIFENAFGGVKGIRLDLIGSTEPSRYMGDLERRASQVGGFRKTRFLGNRSAEEIASIYRSTYCGLFLSASETFGLAPVEMLASGLPLVSTPVGVMKWDRKAFAEFGVLYVDVDDVDGAKRAILQMIKSPPTEEMRRRAREFVLHKYSAEATIGKYLGFYNKV